MKNLRLIIFILSISTFTFGQNNSLKEEGLAKQETVKVKLHNFSMKRFQLYVPEVKSIEAVRFGTSTFCMNRGDAIQFNHKGKNYPLLTAIPADGNIVSYNLRRLVKKQMKELNLN